MQEEHGVLESQRRGSQEGFLGEVSPRIRAMGSTFWGRGDRVKGDRVVCIGKSCICSAHL